eukprot:SAG31_NODE_421_length_15868_cov_8.966453_16_plen_140_part_00
MLIFSIFPSLVTDYVRTGGNVAEVLEILASAHYQALPSAVGAIACHAVPMLDLLVQRNQVDVAVKWAQRLKLLHEKHHPRNAAGARSATSGAAGRRGSTEETVGSWLIELLLASKKWSLVATLAKVRASTTVSIALGEV